MRGFTPLLRIAAALLGLAASAGAQVSGVVTGLRGEPLAGVQVSSGTGSQQQSAITGPDGRFDLTASSTVLHAERDGYQPATLLVSPPAAHLRIQLRPIALSPLSGAILVPACLPLPSRDRATVRLGAPGTPLRFDLPRRDWRLHDLGQGALHEYLLEQKHSGAQLILWFGAFPLIPPDHVFLQSSAFDQRAVLSGGSGPSPSRSIGVDSFGTYPDGTRWRHLATSAAGAEYDRATPAEAQAFDQILAAVCVAPD